MDPVSSSPLSGGIEFGLVPRTPASNRSKNGRTPKGKENSGSGSLHKRMFHSIRSRSRSFSRASDNGSPTTKPIKRRKSIVDLLNFSSRESHNDQNVPDVEQAPKIEETPKKGSFAALFSDMPKKRKSLGNLWCRSNIPGTVANRAEQKTATITQKTSTNNQGGSNHGPLLILPGKSQKNEGKIADRVNHTTTDMHQGDTGPMFVKLADGSSVDIDLFESRLARILNGIVTDSSDNTRRLESDDTYLKILHAICEKDNDEGRSESPDSLRPLLSLRNETNSFHCVTPSGISHPTAPFDGEPQATTKEQRRPRTPDSYIRLLIASCRGPTQDDPLASPASSLQLSESSDTPVSKQLNYDLNENEASAADGEAESTSIQVTPASFFRPFEYRVRQTTPDPYLEKGLSMQKAHDDRPSITVREVSRSSTLLDHDPEFCQRQEERSERYTSLGLMINSDWKSNQERIAQSIASTVARMTRNYHSSSEDFRHFDHQTTKADQHKDDTSFNLRCCGNSFAIDENETWDSIIVGRQLMLQGDTSHMEENLTLEKFELPTNANESSSLFDFDDLSTIPSSSVTKVYPSAKALGKRILLPSVEEILLDSIAIRTPSEPLYAIRRNVTTDDRLEPEREIDFCPEYERFLQRSHGFLTSRPFIPLQMETQPLVLVPRLNHAQILLSSPKQLWEGSQSAVQVRFPGTVNLFQHTESFSSLTNALAGLYNYKLGDLANFYVYDPDSFTVYAHSIDAPVPNPADLKERGLQLHWMMQLNDTNDTPLLAEGSQLAGRSPSRCDSAWEENIFPEVSSFVDERYPTPTSTDPEKGSALYLKGRSSSYLNVPVDARPEKAPSINNSVFDDDFFLEDQSCQFSDQDSVTEDFCTRKVIESAVSEEEVIAALDFEEHVEATKTWVQLAQEVRGRSSRDNQMSESCDGDNFQSSLHGAESTDEMTSDNRVVASVTPVKCRAFSVNDCRFAEEKPTESREEIRQLSISPDIVIDHSPGFHFTAVQEFMVEGSEDELDEKAAMALNHTVEVLYNADDHIHSGIDSPYSLINDDEVLNSTENADITVPLAIQHNDCFHDSDDVEASKDPLLAASNPRSLKYPVQHFTTKLGISDTQDISPADDQENKTTPGDGNGWQADSYISPAKKGKSKVGALVNIFQDYGLMPEQSRGPLQMSSVSPSFSRHTSRFRGQPSRTTSVDSGTVRKTSATLSTGSRSIPPPLYRAVTPTLEFSRPNSRLSDIDTEASFQFGEVLRRTRKHGESEKENAATQDEELYG